MGKEAKLILEQNNDELAGYLEAFLEDFQKIATDMLAAINVDRGATLKIPDAEYNRLKRVTEALDALAKRKFSFDNVPNFQPVVDALGQVKKSIDGFKFPERVAVDIPKMEHNIATPEIDMKPVSQSIERMEKLFLNGIGVRITNFDEMPLVFDKVTGSTGGGVSSEVTVTASALPTGAATNAKLDEVITAIEAIPGGGGVQYTEGDTDASITGTAMMWEDTSDTLRAVSAAKPLPVDVKNTSIAVTGTFWQATQPVSIAATVTVDTELPAAAALSDTIANPTAPAVGGFGMLWNSNASQWERQVAIRSGLNVGGTGITAAGMMAQFDDVTPTSITENQFGNVRMSANRNLYVTLRDAAGNERGLNIDASGQLAITVASIPSHAVTNAGTFSVQESGTHVQVDDAAFTPATSKIMMVGAEFDDTTPDSVDEGDGGAIRMSGNRNLYVRIRDNAGNERGLNVDASGQIAVTLAASQTLATLTNITNWGNIVDNAAFTDGTTRLMMNGYIYDEVAGTALTENDGAAARVDAKRSQIMVIEDETTRGQRMTVTTRKSLLVEGPTAHDAAAAAGPLLIGAYAKAAAPTDVSADGDVVNLWALRNGSLVVNLASGGTLLSGLDLTNSNPLTVAIVDGSGSQITSFGGGTQYTEGDTDATITGTVAMMEAAADTLVALQGTVADGLLVNLGANNDVTVTGTVTVTQGTATNLKTQAEVYQGGSAVAAGNPLQVTLANGSVPSHAVTNAGTFAVQVDGNALTALQLIDDTIFADDAAVTLGTSKGSVMAGVAVNIDGTDPTAVSAEGDAAALRTDPNRILLVNQTHPRFWHASADYASAQTNTSVKAAPGANLSLYITDISISNGATAGNITLLDGSGGTVLYELYPAINGGAILSLRNPIKLTANTALCLTSTTVTTHSIFVSGYIAP